MTDFNPNNERVKRRYVRVLREAEGLSERTIDSALYAIAAYERFMGYTDFKAFNSDRAVEYRKHLLAGGGKKAAEASSRATIHSKLMALRLFFAWLAFEDGFKKSIDVRDADYFKLSSREAKIAVTRFDKPSPTVEQMRMVIFAMPADTDLQKRDRALVALELLTGARVKAVITLKLKHVRYDGRGIDQDAREVETKGAKSYPTFFFPVGSDVVSIFTDYVAHLRSLGFGNDDPLFPSTRQTVGSDHQFSSSGLSREHWQTTDPVRSIFRKAFASAGLPYFNPHSVRRTLVLLGQQRCSTPEMLKAWSQNLGHNEVLTTLTSYGGVSSTRQAQILHQIGLPSIEPVSLADEMAAVLARHSRTSEMR